MVMRGVLDLKHPVATDALFEEAPRRRMPPVPRYTAPVLGFPELQNRGADEPPADQGSCAACSNGTSPHTIHLPAPQYIQV